MFENNSPTPYSSTSKVGIEPTFFGKVMSFFAMGMLSSVIGIFIAQKYLIIVFLNAPFLMWGLFIAELALIFTSRKWSTKVPLNRFLFALFTFISGVTLAPLISLVAAMPEGVPMITKALAATVLMFGATGLVGWTTKIDLSGLRGFLIMGIIGMIIVGVAGLFFPWGNTFELIFSGAGVILFSAFTMYDFQKIKKYPEDRYVDAALALYLDIFNLFIYILRFIMAFNRR